MKEMIQLEDLSNKPTDFAEQNSELEWNDELPSATKQSGKLTEDKWTYGKC